jgi:hypothetical protein
VKPGTEADATCFQAGAVAGDLGVLKEKGYIEAKMDDIQTEGASWVFDSETGDVLVDIGGCDAKIRGNVYSQLSEQEKKFVRGGGG